MDELRRDLGRVDEYGDVFLAVSRMICAHVSTWREGDFEFANYYARDRGWRLIEHARHVREIGEVGIETLQVSKERGILKVEIETEVKN